MAITCLQTKVRNMSGATKFFGFLGAHGKRLASGEEYTFTGDLVTRLSQPNFRTGARKLAAFEAAVNSGDLVIVSTPSQHYYDATLDVTKIITVANSVVNDVDPCWGAYSSSITDPHTV